jgi:succinate dehydrogenase hydrophobic anchor subunit
MNVVVTMITKIGHSHDRHHVFDNVGGNILIIFRCILILTFIWGCIRTYRQVRHTLKKFMVKFFILGFIYIASMPAIVGLANYVLPAKDRHEFVFIAVEVIKFTTNLTLAYEMNY